MIEFIFMADNPKIVITELDRTFAKDYREKLREFIDYLDLCVNVPQEISYPEPSSQTLNLTQSTVWFVMEVKPGKINLLKEKLTKETVTFNLIQINVLVLNSKSPTVPETVNEEFIYGMTTVTRHLILKEIQPSIDHIVKTSANVFKYEPGFKIRNGKCTGEICITFWVSHKNFILDQHSKIPHSLGSYATDVIEYNPDSK